MAEASRGFWHCVCVIVSRPWFKTTTAWNEKKKKKREREKISKKENNRAQSESPLFSQHKLKCYYGVYLRLRSAWKIYTTISEHMQIHTPTHTVVSMPGHNSQPQQMSLLFSCLQLSGWLWGRRHFLTDVCIFDFRMKCVLSCIHEHVCRRATGASRVLLTSSSTDTVLDFRASSTSTISFAGF